MQLAPPRVLSALGFPVKPGLDNERGMALAIAIVALALADTTNNITGNANLLYSKCAIVKALDRAGVASQLRSRAWAQLH